MNQATGPIPHHQYLWVHRQFVRDCLEPGFERAVWFGLHSQPSRIWGCTVLLECGAIYRNLPVHALTFRPQGEPLDPGMVQQWDCYGWDWSACVYPFLDGQRMRVKGFEEAGTYLFSVQPIGDGFSREPEQSKEFTFIRMDGGPLVVQPTDRILVEDASFTDIQSPPHWPTTLRRQRETWSCEGSCEGGWFA